MAGKYGYVGFGRMPSKTLIILNQVAEVLEEYEAELPLTVRQIFYRLVAAYGYGKTENDYKSLVNYISQARRASVFPSSAMQCPYIPFSAIRDDKSTSLQSFFYDSMAQCEDEIRNVGRNFKLDRQTGQPQIVEFWCEAQGILGILAEIARPYSIRVSSCGGYDSVTVKHKLASRVVARAEENIKTVIVHVGDFDPSGERMVDVMRSDVGLMVAQRLTGAPISQERFEREGSPFYGFDRLALTAEQVMSGTYNIITAPPKKTDSNMRWFLDRNQDVVEHFSSEDISVQLESLTPTELRTLLSSAIDKYIDPDEYQRVLDEEQDIRKELSKRYNPLVVMARLKRLGRNGDKPAE